MDEAKRHGLQVDDRRLARDLGVPVVPTSARYNRGLDALVDAIHKVATGEVRPKPRKVKTQSKILKSSLEKLESQILQLYPNLPNARWVALRLLDGDEDIIRSLRSGELGHLIQLEERRPEGGQTLVQEAA
jgi:ferrous iron transport protein B